MAHGQNIGSIGSYGVPVFDAHNDRVKGIYDVVVTSGGHIYPFVEQAREIRDKSGAGRMTLRFITNEELKLEETEGSVRRNGSIWVPYGDRHMSGFETHYIPLSGDWKGFGIQYFGENSRKRMEAEAIDVEEDGIVSESVKTATRRDPFAKAAQRGYDICLGIRSERDIPGLHELYSAVYRDYVFPLTEEAIASLVGSPTSITAIARDANGYVSAAAIAEVAEIPTARGILRISELSDEATHPNHRGNGLNQACVYALVRELERQYGNDIHLIFAEDRACARGVNQQSANLDFVYEGRLNSHCRIDADRDIQVTPPFEDLNVWRLPR